ncbi:hypothetical protein GCM10010405_30850 [Streptomyces macrosporus]|uniref:HTH IS21-type domain-containing protein n=1 Tax=Streptomyces macrosporus TaxID=44032 RepID=A0ABN3K0K8_9ACTN
MPQMSKVELYAAIRRGHRAGMTMRELERKYNVGWRTVRKALNNAWPEPRKPLPPRPSALDPYKAVIDGILRADLDAPRKQRHTVTRIFHRLVEEHGANVSYPMVRRYVADRKPQIAVEAGKAPIEAFVPQTHPPGMEAEVDFGDVAVRLAGELVTCYLFSFRLSYSGKAASTGSSPPPARKPSSRATCTRCGCWAVSRGAGSVTTTSRPPSLRCWG